MEEKMKKAEEKKMEIKEEKVETKIEKEIKGKAIVNGFSLRISPKNSKYICKMIMNKSIDRAIEMLEEVVLKKRAVKMDGAEIPHRKGKGMMSGRYPINAAKEFILLLKQLKANASVNGIENPFIVIAMANKGPQPFRRERRRGKRTHVRIEVIEKTKLKIKKN
jgi:large subunit ribosomal protein L22